MASQHGTVCTVSLWPPAQRAELSTLVPKEWLRKDDLLESSGVSLVSWCLKFSRSYDRSNAGYATAVLKPWDWLIIDYNLNGLVKKGLVTGWNLGYPRDQVKGRMTTKDRRCGGNEYHSHCWTKQISASWNYRGDPGHDPGDIPGRLIPYPVWLWDGAMRVELWSIQDIGYISAVLGSCESLVVITAH